MRKLLPVAAGLLLLFVVGPGRARSGVVFEDNFDNSPTRAPPQNWTERYYGWAGQPVYTPEQAAARGASTTVDQAVRYGFPGPGKNAPFQQTNSVDGSDITHTFSSISSSCSTTRGRTTRTTQGLSHTFLATGARAAASFRRHE